MKKNEITFNSIVMIKSNYRKGYVTGITYHEDDVVGVVVKITQQKPSMYKPSEIKVIKY